jgi:hypothetical protein
VPRVSLQERSSVPRFASEELAEQEFTPLFESRKAVENPAATEKLTIKEAFVEPASFALEPQPVLIEEAPEPPRSAPAHAPVMPALHVNFDEPFEEEYARLIPSKPAEERAASAGRSAETAGNETTTNRTDAEPHLDNLDIPAFLRRPVN